MPASSTACCSSRPAGPTNGRPSRSSTSPGCSPDQHHRRVVGCRRRRPSGLPGRTAHSPRSRRPPVAGSRRRHPRGPSPVRSSTSSLPRRRSLQTDSADWGRVSNERRRVLVTGAAGYIAGQLLPAFRERYDLTLVDVTRTTPRRSRGGRRRAAGPARRPGRPVRRAVRRGRHVVHCGMRPPAGTPSYAAERVNLDMTARVYEVAAGGRRAAGGLHQHQPGRQVVRAVVEGGAPATGSVRRTIRGRTASTAGPRRRTRPSVSSTRPARSAGRWRSCRSASSRPRPIRAEAFADRPLVDYLRDITGWISERDLQQLYVRSIEADSIADPDGVPFQIFYGVSDNARTFWSITNARRGDRLPARGRLRDRVRRRDRRHDPAASRGPSSVVETLADDPGRGPDRAQGRDRVPYGRSRRDRRPA